MRARRIAIAVLSWLLVMQSLSAHAAEVKYFPVQAGDHPHDWRPHRTALSGTLVS